MRKPVKFKYIERIPGKAGVSYWYFRRSRNQPRHRLPGQPGDESFSRRYFELLGAAPRRFEAVAGSLNALIVAYRASDDFRELRPKTQRDYDRCLERFRPIERFPAADIKRRHIADIRAHISGPRAAMLFSQVASKLFSFGIDQDMGVNINPAARMRRAKSESYEAWTAEDYAAFEAATMPAWVRTGYMLGRYLGQRRGDVLSLSRRSFDGQGFTLKQAKTGAELWIPAHRELQRYLTTLPKDSLLFVVDGDRAIDPTRFTKAFRAVLDSAGLDHLDFHGLRHGAGVALAESGASAHVIAALLGHKTLAMVQRYTTQADQKKRAKAAVTILERTWPEREIPKSDD